jgi:pyruvate dehydrogenase E1 component alpha subunit
VSTLTSLDRFTWMARIRAFERACLEGVPTREIHGELHTGIGQEAIAAGLAGWLRDDDALVSTHRNHAHALVKGVNPRALMAEIFERSTGLCGGFGGHMHPFDPSRHFSASGIVGASMPVALGQAYAARIEERDSVAVAITGDGGANHGTFHECMNIASAWGLPLIIVIENNGLAISVEHGMVAATDSLATRADAYEATGVIVDGTDPDAVSEAFGELIDETRRHSRPTVLEADCLRFQGHYEGDPQLYRGELELDPRDPLLLTRRRLRETGVPEDELEAIERAAAAEMQELLASVRLDPSPEPSTALDHVFAGAGDRP